MHASSVANVRFPPEANTAVNWPWQRRSGRLDEIYCSGRSANMSIEVTCLRYLAEKCRRLAESVSIEQDQATFKRVAKEFDKAAAELEMQTS